MQTEAKQVIREIKDYTAERLLHNTKDDFVITAKAAVECIKTVYKEDKNG